MNGTIFDIKRFAIHDGDGIRTTVFLKGCPLKCLWCHNPESLSFKPQLAYYVNKCMHCGSCTGVCPTGAHAMTEAGHVFHRERCIACGKCEEACPATALFLFGKSVTAEDILPTVLEDKEFYVNSGGGVTLSGGECLMQPDFCRELLQLLKAEGIHTAVDTCGFVPRASIEKVLPYTDIFLFDIKAIDPEVHKNCTGQSNELILENLRYIDAMGKAIEVRIPYVPGHNDGEIGKIAAFVKTLQNVTAVKVLPYHNYAGSKYEALDIKNTLPQNVPSPQEVSAAQSLF